MARRFSDINRGPLLNQAFANLQAYRNRSISERNALSTVGTRQSSPRVLVAVDPFGESLPTGVTGYRVRSNERNRAQLADDVGLNAAVPAPTTARFEPGFLPAQIKLFVQTSRSPATSRMTGIRYMRSVGANFSFPFGRQAATDLEWEVFNQIAASATSTNANSRVSYRPEKFRRI